MPSDKNIDPKDRYLTPEARFKDLKNWPYDTHYLAVEPFGLNMAYIDEGPKAGAPFLLLHGNPVWSYSFRDVVPVLVAAGHRVIALDLIGFGKSEKLLKPSYYSYTRQVNWVSSFMEKMQLPPVHLFAQDWGGLIALRVIPQYPEWFETVTISNAGLPTDDFDPGFMFALWEKVISKFTPNFSSIMQMATKKKLEPAVLQAYKAPFDSLRSSIAPRAMPSLLPTSRNPIPEESNKNKQALEQLKAFDKPFLTIFSKEESKIADLLTGIIPGAQGQNHVVWEDMGHFSQDEKGAAIAHQLIDFIQQ